MNHEMAMTTNVRRFLAAVRELTDRPLGVEGMGLLWGQPGEGKSTTVAYATNTLDGIFLRANACWTVTSMLQALMVELGQPQGRFKAPMVDTSVRCLMEQPRPIFVDEADYLLRQANMLDVMRDIYDTTGSPVVLIGMETMARKVQTNGRFARRITQWVEFRGITLADARTLADTICEVGVEDCLLSRLYEAARANIGRMTTGLSRIEQFARINKLESVTLEQWGDRPLFFDQPTFRRKR
jgi:DNA transposition AAA+ family ATPase